MKRGFLAITLLAVLFFSALQVLATGMVSLKQGSLVLVYPKKNLSTATLQEGDRVYFVSPADVWVNETKIVPQNAIFVGYISMLKMPVKGINGAFSVKITHIILPDGTTNNFEGIISTGSSDIIGGGLTPPVSYNKMAHLYQSRWHWSGTTQWVPSGDYEFGRHTTITPSQKLFIILQEPYLTQARE